MKIKKIFLTASLLTLGAVTLASCSSSKTKRNTVTPYGNLNLDETLATAGDLKMTVGQYYDQLRKSGYNVVTNAITKELFKDEIEVTTALFNNETRTDFINNLSKEKLALLECTDESGDSKHEQDKLYDLVSDTTEANEKYLELKKKLVKTVHQSLSNAIYSTSSAKDFAKMKDEDKTKAIAKYIDTVAKDGIFITASDIEEPSIPTDTSYFTKDDDTVEFSQATLAKLQDKINDILLTQGKNLAGKKGLYQVADEEYIYDEKTEDDIKNTYYLFKDTSIKSRYENKLKNYGTYNAIIIQFNSRREAMSAIEAYNIQENDLDNAKTAYLNLYNDYYSKSITSTDDDKFIYTVNQDKDDMSDLPSEISSLIKDTLEDGDYLTLPRNINNKYVMAMRISTEYQYFKDGDSSKQADWSDFDDEQKAELENKIKEDLITETTSYTSKVEQKRIDDATIEIYDPYFENSYYNSYSDYYDLNKTSVSKNTTSILKVNDFEYSIDDFYKDASKKYATNIITNYFELEFANSYYDKFVDMYLIDDELADTNKDALKEDISKFKKNKNQTYGKELGLETYLLAQYGYTNEDDILKYYYNATKALSVYKSIKVYDAWRSAEADADGKYSVSAEAKTGFLNNLLNTGNSYYNELFSINLDHILINIDYDGDGSPDDPDDFFEGKSDAEIADFENAVVELARAIYNEASNPIFANSSYYDTLKFIKTRFEEGANLFSDPSLSWDDYKDYNFLLTVEQLASSSDITQTSVSSFVKPFKDYVIDLYKSVSSLGDSDTYKKEKTSEAGTYEYENGKFYYVNTETKEGGFIEDSSDITENTLCKTSFGYHLLLINSYTLSSELSFTEDEASEYQKNIELTLRSYVDSDDKTQKINLNISSLNEPDGDEKITSASFNQFFIYYVQKANSASTSLTTSIYEMMSKLFDESISKYTGSEFQDYLLLKELDIKIAKTSDVLSNKNIESYIKSIENSIIDYDNESRYLKWIDGTYTWEKPEIK